MPLARQLALTQKSLHTWTEAVLAEHGSSLTTWIVLNNAALAPPPGLSQRELADGMGIGGPALVRHIDRLEAEGLVERTRDPHDRRVMRITLTPTGHRHRDDLHVIMSAIDDDLCSHLSEAEQRTMRTALEVISRYAAETPTTAIATNEASRP